MFFFYLSLFAYSYLQFSYLSFWEVVEVARDGIVFYNTTFPKAR